MEPLICSVPGPVFRRRLLLYHAPTGATRADRAITAPRHSRCESIFRDSSLNSTIPELPGSGWLAAEPERGEPHLWGRPQTHRLRPWGFPACHPTLWLAAKSDGVFRRVRACGTMHGHWAIEDAPYMEVHACLLPCLCRFARRSGRVTNRDPRRPNWPRPSTWHRAQYEGCCSGDARTGWKAWRQIAPDPTRPASRNTRRGRRPCICVSNTPVGELA
jgi:hypothetical protein